MKRFAWYIFYFLLAGANFGYVLKDHDFSSGFNLAAALLCIVWAYEHAKPEAKNS